MIDSQKEFVALIDRSMQAPCVALDTEFVWERTYYAQLGVVQLALSQDDCHLIDTVALKDLKPLGKLLANSAVEKILHDAQQDLTILYKATEGSPKNVFDTRQAAGFSGPSSTLSLRHVVHEATGVSLAKTESRSDWLKRPLTSQQVEYALDDVRYLCETRTALLDRARARDREAWLLEESAGYDDPSLYYEPDPRLQFLRVKGARRLSAARLVVLRELAAWRELEARKRDRPRGHIMSDDGLIAVARRTPKSMSDLKAITALSERVVSRCGKALLAAVAAGEAADGDECPQFPETPTEDDATTSRIDFALAYMKGKSVRCQIDPALVASRSEVASLVHAGKKAKPGDHRLLAGWRGEFIGDELLMLLRGESGIQIDPATGLPRLVGDKGK